jgi:hypothetical protein
VAVTLYFQLLPLLAEAAEEVTEQNQAVLEDLVVVLVAALLMAILAVGQELQIKVMQVVG